MSWKQLAVTFDFSIENHFQLISCCAGKVMVASYIPSCNSLFVAFSCAPAFLSWANCSTSRTGIWAVATTHTSLCAPHLVHLLMTPLGGWNFLCAHHNPFHKEIVFYYRFMDDIFLAFWNIQEAQPFSSLGLWSHSLLLEGQVGKTSGVLESSLSPTASHAGWNWNKFSAIWNFVGSSLLH